MQPHTAINEDQIEEIGGDPDDEAAGEDENAEGEKEPEEEEVDLEVDNLVEESDGEETMVNGVKKAEGEEDDEEKDTEEAEKDAEEKQDAELADMRGQLRYDRRNYASRLIACWIFQVIFSILILSEAFAAGQLDFNETPTLKIGFTRFIASMVMHVVVSEEIQNGLRMMKYSANHWWKFSNPRLAWLSGFL